MQEDTLPERRDIIHRCYMTGQRCVYARDLLSRHASGGFSLSQFSADFNHIWEFNLKSWLDGKLKRADLVARTGYVMCSRICYPIQEAKIIVADVTTGNLNVFYELGLACALRKRVLILRHERKTPEEVTKFLHTVGLSGRTHAYKSDDDDFSESRLLANCEPVAHFRGATPGSDKVLVFSNENQEYLWTAGKQGGVLSRATKISNFVKRALQHLDASSIAERCKSLLSERGDSERAVLPEHVQDYIGDLRNGISTSKLSMMASIAGADLVLVDTSLHDFETYFWLGLCHGLEKEVIPLSISDEDVKQPALPFDIRTLWHVGGSFDHPDPILSQLKQILTEIIAKRLGARATLDRDHFWRPIFEAPSLAFFLGTERSGQLESKQVVGEWDLRTIQEINSFVLRGQSNSDVVIERPVFRKKEYADNERAPFEQFVKKRMCNANCVVIGTPDVNPAAELILSALKGKRPFSPWVQHGSNLATRISVPPDIRSGSGIREGYVAFKNYLQSRYDPGPSSFFVQFESKEPQRGFIYFDDEGKPKERYQSTYVPRDEFPNADYSESGKLEWDLLGHVIVAPNPFASGYPNTRLRVIMIMGIGGPATLGIAHFLTGRRPTNVSLEWDNANVQRFFADGNAFLKAFNELMEKYDAAEGIVKVHIAKQRSNNDQYEDSRDIAVVSAAASLPGVQNPKQFMHVRSQPSTYPPGSGRPVTRGGRSLGKGRNRGSAPR